MVFSHVFSIKMQLVKYCIIQKNLVYFSISALWLAVACFINPIGEFPLNDDWAYTHNVVSILNGNFELSDWPAMTLISQTLYGVVWCKIFGFSFSILRISVLTIGLAGLFLLYHWFLQLTKNKKQALLISFTLTFNPIYFSLCYTFMTDVPFLVSCIAAAYCYYKYFNGRKLNTFFYATFFSAIATMIRQPGLLLPASFLLLNLFFYKQNLKILFIAAISLLGISAVLFGYQHYIKSIGQIPESYSSVSLIFRALQKPGYGILFFKRIAALSFFYGLFLLPVVTILTPYWWKTSSKRLKIAAVCVASLILIPTFIYIQKFPIGNVFYNLGLGPKVLKDSYWRINLSPVFPVFVLWIIYIVGAIGSFLLTFSIVAAINQFILKQWKDQALRWHLFIFIILLGYFWFLMFGNYFFDRYFLPILFFLPFFLIPATFKVPQINNWIASGILGIMILFSVAATHDYLSWNKAKWTGLNKLSLAGISPNQIDGGFEFNGWYKTGKRNPEDPSKKSWYFVDDDKYVVSFGPICNYHTIDKHSYFSYLTLSTNNIYVKERDHLFDSLIVTCNTELLNKDSSLFISSNPDILFKNIETRYKEEAHTGKCCILTNKTLPYSLTTTLREIEPCQTIKICVWTRYNHGQAGIVIASPDMKQLFKSKSPEAGSGSNQWQQFCFEYKIPSNYTETQLTIFLWNHGGKKALFDDLEILILKPKI